MHYGPFYPTTVAVIANSEAGDGGVAWSDPGNVVGDNDSEAQTVLHSESGPSKILKCTGFGCDLPAKAVLGIRVEVEAQANGLADFFTLRLVVGGTPAGQNKGDWDPPVSNQLTMYFFGGQRVTWAILPTATKLNASDFGVALAFASTTNGTVKVRRVKVTVYCED